MNRRRSEIGSMLWRLRRFLYANIRWFTRAALLLVVLLVLVHGVYPAAIDWLGGLVGLQGISAANVLALLVLIVVLERIVVLEDLATKPPFRVDQPRDRAYNKLFKQLSRSAVRNVDLLQASGQVSLRFLRKLAERHPNAKGRLLLLQPDVIARYDSDDNPNHRDRIDSTMDELALIRADYPGFQVDVRHYDSPPGLSAIIVDNRVAALSWYITYRDPSNPEITRLRGHAAPTLVVSGDRASELVGFARAQFDAVWKTASDRGAGGTYDSASPSGPAAPTRA